MASNINIKSILSYTRRVLLQIFTKNVERKFDYQPINKYHFDYTGLQRKKFEIHNRRLILFPVFSEVKNLFMASVLSHMI